MTELERMIADNACRALLHRYATAVDRHDWADLASLFAADLEWKRPGMQPLRSHDEIRARFQMLEEQRRLQNAQGHLTRHMFTTVSVQVVSETIVTSIAYAQVFRVIAFDGNLPAPMPPGPELIVEYRDRFAPTEAGWRIKSHEAVHVFRASHYRTI